MLADGGEEALEILSSDTAFDLVLTDMQMPFMDGVMFSELVKKKYPLLPIILLSSIGDEFSKNKGDLFTAALTKPIKQHVLGKCILNALQRHDCPGTEEKNA